MIKQQKVPFTGNCVPRIAGLEIQKEVDGKNMIHLITAGQFANVLIEIAYFRYDAFMRVKILTNPQKYSVLIQARTLLNHRLSPGNIKP